jgi:hypothetical protein
MEGGCIYSTVKNSKIPLLRLRKRANENPVPVYYSRMSVYRIPLVRSGGEEERLIMYFYLCKCNLDPSEPVSNRSMNLSEISK